MKHKYFFILPVIILIGAVLFGAGWFLMGADPDNRSGKLELDSFANIDLSVMSGDVTITEGDGYAVEYRLHGREKVKRAEVVNNTLYFDTGFDMQWKPGTGDWFVMITVPAGTEFESVRLKTTAGDIDFANYNFQNGTFETTAGDVEISGVLCDTLNVHTVSDDITLTACTVAQKAELETVSGDIEVEAPFSSIQAKSVGGISFNGADQGRRFSIGQGTPELEASSVSGDIEIVTADSPLNT